MVVWAAAKNAAARQNTVNLTDEVIRCITIEFRERTRTRDCTFPSSIRQHVERFSISSRTRNTRVFQSRRDSQIDRLFSITSRKWGLHLENCELFKNQDKKNALSERER